MNSTPRDETQLPDDLIALERQLAERGGPEPPPDLRPQILAAVGRELWRPAGGKWPGWGWLAGAAAALLVGINFSTSVINNMDWHFADGILQDDLETTARQVKDLVPEMSEREAFRQALLLRAGSQVVPGPAVRVSLQRVLKQREREPWDMH